ncbi:serine/threonine-protein kinase [Pseudonocardia acaciae]|uniref:serine/threonine-protein kinase n=1 Tax=Pseudonocardia acaciae TaxID=551276 RepID=UPI00055AC478|nr:serine/threonine-protein kinase [Pseudonocardia acaciae]
MTLTPDASPLVLAERYRLDERVGAGSMGTVWRATDQLLGRTVAVKQLLFLPGTPGFDTRGYEEAKQRILREGRLAARLQHPHTIAVFDVVLHNDAPWLVMEYMPSRTLSALLLSESPVDPLRIAAIGWQIADGLSAAHAAGIVHRDIKPANVLIGDDSKVKITDFGVSRAADDVQLTRTGMIAGTPAYLAPEIARGQTPTPASDIFALGSTLYTAVEGEPPFGLDDNAYALLYKVGRGDVRPPERAGPLTDTLMRMLRKDPAERPTAAHAREELAALVGGQSQDELLAGRSRSRPRNASPKAPAARRPTARATRVDLSVPPDAMPVPPPRPATARAGVGRPAGAPATPRPRSRRRFWAALSVVVVAAGAALALALPGLGGGGGLGSVTGQPPASAAPGGSDPARPANGQPTAAELEGFVRDYYALLPGQPDAAWAKLGDLARRQSGSLDSYRGFYGSLDAITLTEGPTAVSGRTVRATLRFESSNGSTSTERYEFTVVPGPDGRLVMSSFARR